MTTTSTSGVGTLQGEVVSAVCFVRDYVEFHFDGKILRALTNPSLVLNSDTHLFPCKGSRDALCSLIGRTVSSVEICEGQRISIDFSGSAALAISLLVQDRLEPEAAHFVPGENQPIEVW